MILYVHHNFAFPTCVFFWGDKKEKEKEPITTSAGYEKTQILKIIKKAD